MPWNEKIKQKLQICMEAGIVDYLTRKYLPGRSSQSQLDSAGPSAFKIDHFVLAFGVLALGMGIGLVSAWLERLPSLKRYAV